MMQNKIGITESCDPTLNLKWVDWVRSGKPAILITKAPKMLSYLIQKSDNIIVHCTITGLGGSTIEPFGVPYENSLKSYHELCSLLSPERVVLRIDPIFYFGEDLPYLFTLKHIASEAEGRVRISFVDLYPHVLNRLYSHKIQLPYETFHLPLDIRKNIWKELGKPEICCEPNMQSVPCVGEKDCEILGVEPSPKLKGQRPLCGCLANKVELCTRPPRCTYGCLYCYWK